MQTASLDRHPKGIDLPLLYLGDLAERFRLVRSSAQVRQVVAFDVTKPSWYRTDAGSPDQPLEPGQPLNVVLEAGVHELSVWFSSHQSGARVVPRLVG